MPRPLKHSTVPQTYDFGQAVTLVLSTIKDLDKHHNKLVDDIEALNTRKILETKTVEKLLARKTEILKVSDEVTQKIIQAKSDLAAEVSKANEKIAIERADITTKGTKLAEDTKAFETRKQETESELGIERERQRKDHLAAVDGLNRRENDLQKRETVVSEAKAEIQQGQTANNDTALELDVRKSLLDTREGDLRLRADSLDTREAELAQREQQNETTRLKLSTLASDLEAQAKVIETSRSKNDHDLASIRQMNKRLYDKQVTLDNREAHLNDRESTISSHM